MKISNIFKLKNQNQKNLQEAVNFNNNYDFENAAKQLEKALKKGYSQPDKYQILMYIVAKALYPSFKKMDAVWAFMKFVSGNASKGNGFKMNQDINQLMEKKK
jgi:hypothetical protein